MTVQNDKTKEVLLGDGITTVFPYTFALLDKSHIKVYLTDLDGNTTMLESGYSVDTKNSNVIYPYPFGKPLPAGWKMTIMRVVPVTQEMDLINQGALPNETLEKAYDKLTMIAQQLNEESNRSLKADVSVIGAPYQLPAPAPGKAIGWNADGTGMFNYDNPGEASLQAKAEANRAKEEADRANEEANRAEEAAETTIEIVDSMAPWYVGDLEPANTFPWMVWVSTADGYIKQRNGADTEWITRAPISGSWGVPVGTIITLAGLPANLPGWVHLTGTTLVRADYPLLWEFALNSNNVVTDEEWFSQKRYGSFSYGDGETTFRVMLLVDFVRGFDPASGKTMGQWVEDTFQGHYHKIIEPIGTSEASPQSNGLDFWEETDEYITLQDHGFKTGQAVADGINGEPRIGPETAPKHILLPKYIYTGEVW